MSLETPLQSKHQLNVLLGIKDSKLGSSQGPKRQPRQLLVAQHAGAPALWHLQSHLYKVPPRVW